MADMWAAGIIMYELITGRHPYFQTGMTREEMITTLSTIKMFKFPKNISPEAKHLIMRLCTRESAQRFKAKEALNHPWVTREVG